MHGVLTWEDVHPDVQARIRALPLKVKEQRARDGITGDPSNMIAHEASVDSDCSAAFRDWLAGQPERARLEEERASAARARMGKTREQLLEELRAELRRSWK